MKTLFSKKMMIVYIIILCLTFIAGSVSLGVSVNYSEKYTKAVEEAKKESNTDPNLSQLENAVLGLIANAVANEAGINASGNVPLTDEAREYRMIKRNSTTSFIVLYVLSLLSVAGVVTSAQYQRYLKSEKYKAKLKRMKKYENSYNTGM